MLRHKNIADLYGAKEAFEPDLLATYVRSTFGDTLGELISTMFPTLQFTAHLEGPKLHDPPKKDYATFLRTVRDRAKELAQHEVRYQTFTTSSLSSPNLLTFLHERLGLSHRSHPAIHEIGHTGLSGMTIFANLDSGFERAVQLDYMPPGSLYPYARVSFYEGASAINVEAFGKIEGNYSNLEDVPEIHRALVPDITRLAECIVKKYGTESTRGILEA